MKNVILIVVNMMIAVLTFAILMTLNARMARYEELDANLSSITEEAVSNLMQSGNYEINDYSSFLADLVDNLEIALDSESDVVVKVMGADIEKGLLSMEVIQHYQHLNGKMGTVSCERTVIFNQLLEEEVPMYQVTFYITKNAMDEKKDYYKRYTVLKGSLIQSPKIPEKENSAFAGWYDINGNQVDFSEEITKDSCYYAQWN